MAVTGPLLTVDAQAGKPNKPCNPNPSRGIHPLRIASVNNQSQSMHSITIHSVATFMSGARLPPAGNVRTRPITMLPAAADFGGRGGGREKE